MMNERSSGQTNTTTSANMQYGYPTSPFDMMNMPQMQNPSDVYSYYPPSLYQPFGAFDEHNQWGSTDTSAGVPPPPPGSLQFHPQMYTPSPLDIPRSPFDYPPPHAYPHYHPGFTPSSFPGPQSTGTSAFDMPWHPHNLTMQQQMQVAAHQQMTPIGGNGLPSNKKPSAYDEYPSTGGGVSDMLAQHMNSVNIGHDNTHNYDNGTNDNTQNVGMLSSKDQQHYQLNSSNHSLSRPSQTSSSSGPKSYASVVSSDTINPTNTKSNSSIRQIPPNERNNSASNFSNDSFNTRSNTQQQSRNGTTGYNSRNQQQQQSSGNEGFLNWTNKNSPNYSDRSSNNNNKRQNYPSSRNQTNSNNSANQETFESSKRNQQYNPKDFNLNPKGARFFVIKSYSEDDVHRSIKYNIWCSTEHGNKRLDTAFREREGKGPVYLFYSVNASGHFCGMAEMMSPLDYEHQTNVWHMSNKWQGKFEVKWIYVKDVPNQQFRNIRLENNDNKPVTNSRDTQEIPYEKGKLMLKTMHMYRDKTSIFDDFQYYETKQADEVTKQPTNDDFNNNTRGNNNNNRRQLDQQQQQQQENENNEEE